MRTDGGGRLLVDWRRELVLFVYSPVYFVVSVAKDTLTAACASRLYIHRILLILLLLLWRRMCRKYI